MSALSVCGEMDQATVNLAKQWLNDNWEKAGFRKKKLHGSSFGAGCIKALQTFLNATVPNSRLVIDGKDSSLTVKILRKFLNLNWDKAGFRDKKLTVVGKIKDGLENNPGTIKALQTYLNSLYFAADSGAAEVEAENEESEANQTPQPSTDAHPSADIESKEGESESEMNPHNEGNGDENAVSNNDSQEATVSKDESTKKAAGGKRLVVAMYDYHDDEDRILDLKEGMQLTLLEEADGWGHGETEDGQSGWFPMSYVQVVEGGEDETQGPIPIADRVYAKAAYAYDATGDDEIDLAEDDIVVVVENEVMEGWSRGQNRRRVGLYPSAYCEPLPVSSLTDVKTLSTVIAVKDVDGELPGDLPFKKGDRMQIISKNGGDFWCAKLNDGVGDIPRKAVKLPPKLKPSGKKAPPPPPKPKAAKRNTATRASTSQSSDKNTNKAAAEKSLKSETVAAMANFANAGMAFEKRVWQFQAFRDIFLDSYLCGNIAATQPDRPTGASPVEKRLYSETYRFMVRVIQDVASRMTDVSKELGLVAESLLAGQSLMDSSPIGIANAAQLHAVCSDIVNRVKALHGSYVIVPIGWTLPTSGALPEGHVMFLTISKDGGHVGMGGQGTCTVALTNTRKDPGFGLHEYHAMHIDQTSKFKQNLTFVLRRCLHPQQAWMPRELLGGE